MKITVLDSASLGTDLPLNILNKLGETKIYQKSSQKEVESRIKDAEVILVNKIKIDDELMNKAKNLKLICLFATGYDNIDIDSAKKRGIAVCNVPGYSTDSVALYTMSIALALYTKLKVYSKFVSDGSYTSAGIPNKVEPIYHELRDKVWGIIGCGDIGKNVARIAEALGAKVIVNKRTESKEFRCVDIDTLCRESDIITVHCSLNEQSRNLINKETISLMKPEVCIVNMARGAVVNENDVTDAILNGAIGAYGSDVYTVEPIGKQHPFYKIKERDNVILTPHCAWASYESRMRCLQIVYSNIEAYKLGKCKNQVNS